MAYETFILLSNQYWQTILNVFSSTQTYVQLTILIAICSISFAAAYKIRHSIGIINNKPLESAHPVRERCVLFSSRNSEGE